MDRAKIVRDIGWPISPDSPLTSCLWRAPRLRRDPPSLRHGHRSQPRR